MLWGKNAIPTGKRYLFQQFFSGWFNPASAYIYMQQTRLSISSVFLFIGNSLVSSFEFPKNRKEKLRHGDGCETRSSVRPSFIMQARPLLSAFNSLRWLAISFINKHVEKKLDVAWPRKKKHAHWRACQPNIPMLVP